MEHLSFPNESADYRRERNRLLAAEMELRGQTETVAVMRRSLPPGGLSEEDYVFRRLDPLHREEDGNSYTADYFGSTAGLAAAMRAERGNEDERDCARGAGLTPPRARRDRSGLGIAGPAA
ncbi:MAG: hypothetical protein K0R64_2155 [Novosphingobium lindaniclasticum]|jgi:hypothetical protein|uniref:DUF899 family protein n=1 Tax=Novosphingobium lindaniclasticum TaxID=1329895 RepID=UPI0024093A2E|nr:DUF899 family protein [Novosphingobium lindaniclasticum]MDF2639171.1 hypothetical protein [Novosphingobium lindaniclasticum]